MILDVRVWKKKTPAGRICTSNLVAHGFPPTETINLFWCFLRREEQELDSK
jgi:hypothetical protein